MITKKQIALVQTLISKAHLRAQKDDMLLNATNGRTSHVNELTEEEARMMIEYLQSVTKDISDKGDKQRKLIIHYAHQMGWKAEAPSLTLPQEGRERPAHVDMQHINEWCMKYGYLHKPLMQYNSKELPKLVSQFERVYKSFLNSI